jgi:hypothetical protein
MKSYKITGITLAALAILGFSAVPSYAWQPRTRVGQRIAARGGILSKIGSARASCGSSAAASCGGSAASFSVATCGSTSLSCAGSEVFSKTTNGSFMQTPVSVPTSAPVSAPAPVYMTAPEPVYMSAPDCSSGQCTPIRSSVQAVAHSAKGSIEFATRLAREGRMYHDRSYIGYENVASGASSPEDAVRMWMRSPGHRRNMPYITDIQCVNGYCVGR